MRGRRTKEGFPSPPFFLGGGGGGSPTLPLFDHLHCALVSISTQAAEPAEGETAGAGAGAQSAAGEPVLVLAPPADIAMSLSQELWEIRRKIIQVCIPVFPRCCSGVDCRPLSSERITFRPCFCVLRCFLRSLWFWRCVLRALGCVRPLWMCTQR